MIETKFKQTEIGLIPEDWEVKRLGDMCSIYRGGSPRPIESYITDDVNGINWIKIGDVASSSKYITKTKEKIRPDGALRSRKVYAGDFILSNSMSFGRPYILKIEGCIHDGWLAIQDYQNYFDLNYLYYLLGSEFVFEQYKKMAAGSSVQNLNKEKVSNVIVLIPEIYEQQRIATALSDVDALISALDKKIEKKKLIKQGAMQQLLTGKKRLQGFTEPWEEKRLGEILQYEQPTKYIISSTAYKANGIPVLTAGKTFILGYTHEYWGVYHNVPVIIFDDFVTESKYVTFPFKVKSSAIKILSLIDSNNSLRYVYEIMQTIDFPMTDHKRYWIKEYSQQTILLPPCDEQNAIASVLSSMDKEIANLESKRAKYEQIKQGMMQQLLIGKIRLINK